MTTKSEEHGVQVTRNGYGIHVGTWDRGGLHDLTADEAQELLDKLTEILHPTPKPPATAWVVVPQSPGMPVSEHDLRRTGVNLLPCELGVAEHAVNDALARGGDVRTGLLSLGEAFETAWQQRKHNPAYIVDHGDGTYTVAL